MRRAEGEPVSGCRAAPRVRTKEYRDSQGRPTTEDPEAAVSGEIAEYGAHGRLRHRTTFFFLTERELQWLPVSEPAFLLWVLAGLMTIWLVIGLLLYLV